MNGINPGMGPDKTGQTGTSTPASPASPQSGARSADADTFAKALEGSESGPAEQTAPEGELTPEQELRKMMSEQSVKQFMERSKEFVDEMKKNMEG